MTKCQRCGKNVDPIYPHTCTPLALRLADYCHGLAAEIAHIHFTDDLYAAGDELRRLHAEMMEADALRELMASILTRTADALKGAPPDLTRHSWHDLPEVAQTLRAALSAPRNGEWERLLELKAELEREKASRKAAQIENEELKARIARSGVEQRRAVLAEREACAKVCDERAGTVSLFGTAKECAAHNSAVNECAAAIRARSKPQGEAA